MTHTDTILKKKTCKSHIEAKEANYSRHRNWKIAVSLAIDKWEFKIKIYITAVCPDRFFRIEWAMVFFFVCVKSSAGLVGISTHIHM